MSSAPDRGQSPASLRQFLGWVVSFVCTFAVLEAVSFLLHGDRRAGIAAAALAVYLCLLAASAVLAGRSRTRLVLVLITGGGLAFSFLMAVVQPRTLPTLMLVPVLLVLLILPHLDPQALRRTLMGCALAMAAMAALADLAADPLVPEPPLTRHLRLASLPAVIALMLVLFWQHHRRLDEMLSGSRAVNEDLARAQRALQEEKELLEALFVASPAGVIMLDLQGRVQRWNSAAERIYGWSEAEVQGTPLPLVPMEEREHSRSIDERALRGEMLRGLEVRRQRKDGSAVDVSLSVAPVRDPQGNVIGIVGVTIDVTERKQAEREQARLLALIRNAAREWTQTADAVDTLIMVVGPDARVRRLNRAVKELAGRSYQEITGQPLAMLGPGQPWQAAQEVAMRVGETRAPTISHVRDETGGRTWEIAGSLAASDDPAEERRIVVARDLTGMVELQESLRRSGATAAMGALVAGVAHEVRNPLFSIGATLDAFEARFGQQERHERYISVLRAELDRLAELMRDLLEYGRPASLQLAATRLDDLVRQAVRGCTALARRRGVRVMDRVPPGIGLVAVDRERMARALQNLVENAIQHTPSQGTVLVEASVVRNQHRRWLECVVKDSGPGFAEQDLSRIFEPFFTRRQGGTGLGLSIVQRIVDEHGGVIGAGNRPEGGAAVTVRIPSLDEAPDHPWSANAEERRPSEPGT